MKRTAYYKKDGELKKVDVDGFTGDDAVDTNKDYMIGLKVAVNGVETGNAVLVCIK